VKFVIVLKGKLSLAFTSKYCLFTVHGCNGESVKKNVTMENQITGLQLHHPERNFQVNNRHCTAIVAISVFGILKD
jgi:hypothetical protein